ncbi:MAG TPA: metallophosphoesterase [Chthoniobacteraceae bacterium]|nr:metallophosphoesterase [Chthoniobacteraceae bacterium]
MNPTPLAVDKSLLPDCLEEIVIISDGHYAIADAPSSAEFASRRKQAARLDVALALAGALKPSRVIHLGDLTQEPPESPDYETARECGLALFRAHGIEPVWVPGNHDVGDKPDPTMAAAPVSESFLKAFEANFGPQWSSLASGNARLFFLNSQIFSSGLESEARQKAWLEAALAGMAPGERALIFLHLPPYLHDPQEPDLGHYDNLPKSARQWLLELCERHRVEWVLSGHVHQRFLNLSGATRLVTCASPAFTRPTFGHLFSSAPPPEQGRDDTPKEGIYLLRIDREASELFFIRTGGATRREELLPKGGRLVVVPRARDLPDLRLGVTLLHPLSTSTRLPIAWQSSVRVPVRNDYPFFLLEELGAGFVRVPLEDLLCTVARERLRLLQSSGVRVEATFIWDASGTNDLPEAASMADTIEFQLPGRIPDREMLRSIATQVEGTPLPVRLSPIFAGEKVAGKQHCRTRYAWYLSELDELEKAFDAAAFRPGAVLVQPDAGADLSQWVEAFAASRALPGVRLDLLFNLGSTDDAENLKNAVHALLAAYRREACRVYFQPFQDLDRSMDVMNGLLDTRCNPRPVFTALKVAHALAAAGRVAGDAAIVEGGVQVTEGASWLDLQSGALLDPPFHAAAGPLLPLK